MQRLLFHFIRFDPHLGLRFLRPTLSDHFCLCLFSSIHPVADSVVDRVTGCLRPLEACFDSQLGFAAALGNPRCAVPWDPVAATGPLPHFAYTPEAFPIDHRASRTVVEPVALA